MKTSTKQCRVQRDIRSSPQQQEDIPAETMLHIILLVLDSLVQKYGSGESSSPPNQHDANQQTPENRRHSSKSAESSSRKRKGSAAQPNEEDSLDDEDEPPQRPRQRPRTDEDSKETTLACPFYKKDPWKYRQCGATRLRDIGRVKQHLNRKHDEPIHCDRCSKTFRTEHERIEHSRQTNRCNVKTPKMWEAVNKTHKQKLASRKRSFGSHETVQKWYAIYRMFFSDALEPASPYLASYEIRMRDEILAFAKSESPVTGDNRQLNTSSVGSPTSFELEYLEGLLERWAAATGRGISTSIASNHQSEKATPPSFASLVTNAATTTFPKSPQSNVLSASKPIVFSLPRDSLASNAHVGVDFRFQGTITPSDFPPSCYEDQSRPGFGAPDKQKTPIRWGFPVDQSSTQSPSYSIYPKQNQTQSTYSTNMQTLRPDQSQTPYLSNVQALCLNGQISKSNNTQKVRPNHSQTPAAYPNNAQTLYPNSFQMPYATNFQMGYLNNSQNIRPQHAQMSYSTQTATETAAFSKPAPYNYAIEPARRMQGPRAPPSIGPGVQAAVETANFRKLARYNYAIEPSARLQVAGAPLSIAPGTHPPMQPGGGTQNSMGDVLPSELVNNHWGDIGFRTDRRMYYQNPET